MLYANVVFETDGYIFNSWFINDILTWNNPEAFKDDIRLTIKAVYPDCKIKDIFITDQVDLEKHKPMDLYEWMHGMLDFVWEKAE